MNHRINFSIKSKLIELQQKKAKTKTKTKTNKQTNKRKAEEDSKELVIVP